MNGADMAGRARRRIAALTQKRRMRQIQKPAATNEPASRNRTGGLPRITARPSVHGRHTIFQIRTERFILGVLGPQRSEISISASQATDRSTFCPMPGGRSQAASDAPRTEAVLLGHWRALRGRDRPAHDSPQIPDSPAAFLESCRAIALGLS